MYNSPAASIPASASLSPSFYRWDGQGLGTADDWPEVPQLVRVTASLSTWALLLPKSTLYPHPLKLACKGAG